jgi:hypothetical protein
MEEFALALARKVQRKVPRAGPLPNRFRMLFDQVSDNLRVWEGLKVEDAVQRKPPLCVPVAEPMWHFVKNRSDRGEWFGLKQRLDERVLAVLVGHDDGCVLTHTLVLCHVRWAGGDTTGTGRQGPLGLWARAETTRLGLVVQRVSFQLRGQRVSKELAAECRLAVAAPWIQIETTRRQNSSDA